jgi:hypothetical protein
MAMVSTFLSVVVAAKAIEAAAMRRSVDRVTDGEDDRYQDI